MVLARILILIWEIDVFYRNSDNEKANDPCINMMIIITIIMMVY